MLNKQISNIFIINIKTKYTICDNEFLNLKYSLIIIYNNTIMLIICTYEEYYLKNYKQQSEF